MKRVKDSFYRYTLMSMLGVTRLVSAMDYQLPTKWYAVIDSLRASSGVLHERLSSIDEEVEEEFRQKEEMLVRRLGRKKFYSPEEIRELQDRVKDIRIDRSKSYVRD